jgi:acylglycerol lipase
VHNRPIIKDPGSNPLPTVLLDPKTATIKPAVETVRGSDGSPLTCRVWQGQIGSPVAIYLHGIEGHSQWFENTAAVLNSRGITVYAPDRRGAGMNRKDRGDLSDHKTYLADVESMIRSIGSHYAGQAVVLIANCWSARAAAIIAREDYAPQAEKLAVPLSGLILTCPAIYSKIDFPGSIKFQILFEWLQGSYRVLRTWPIPLTPKMFTSNPPYLDFIEKDPLRLTDATTSFYVQTYILGWRARRAPNHINIPTLVLQAGNDPIADNEKTKGWYAQLKTTHKTMRIFPDASHSLDFDQTWFRDYTHLMTEWILAIPPLTA